MEPLQTEVPYNPCYTHAIAHLHTHRCVFHIYMASPTPAGKHTALAVILATLGARMHITCVHDQRGASPRPALDAACCSF